jgi:polyhydroxyalkanoate synthesis regulator phasin
MNFSRAAIAAYVGLIFASGAVLGFYGNRLYVASQDSGKPAPRPNPEEFRKKLLDTFRDRLHLSDEQVSKLNVIMDETKSRVEETRRQMKPAYQKIHEEQDQKIRQMLTPDQLTEFDKILKERQDHQKNGRGVSR